MFIQTRRPRLAVFAALLLLLATAACKKEDDAPASTKAEKLGDLAPNKGDIGFNLAGEPLMQVNAFVYEWSSAGKTWHKLGSELWPQAASNGVRQYAQDQTGTYYLSDGDHIYACASATGTWVKVNFPGIAAGQSSTLLANELGDIVVMMQDDSNVYQYFTKKTTATQWRPVASVPYASFASQTPYYFCNNGALYLTADFAYPYGHLTDQYLDTNTDRFAQLYDKSEPANIPLGKDGYIEGAYMQIHPSGTVYLWKDNDLSKLDGAVLPAKVAKVKTFDNPLNGAHGAGWGAAFGPFAITAAGDIKTLGSCNKYPSTHFSRLVGNSSQSGMRLLEDELTQCNVFVNKKNEMFLLEYPSNILYKWN